jgi:hypothetical protein
MLIEQVANIVARIYYRALSNWHLRQVNAAGRPYAAPII